MTPDEPPTYGVCPRCGGVIVLGNMAAGTYELTCPWKNCGAYVRMKTQPAASAIDVDLYSNNGTRGA